MRVCQQVRRYKKRKTARKVEKVTGGTAPPPEHQGEFDGVHALRAMPELSLSGNPLLLNDLQLQEEGSAQLELWAS